MHHWIDGLTPLRVWPKTIDGVQYNHIRLGILRLGTPLYLPLPEFPGLICALDPRTWFVFDENQNGIPILVWRSFHRQTDSALQAPVTCELRTYHVHAGLIMGRALDAIERAIERVLDARLSTAPQLRMSSASAPTRIR